MIRKEENKKSPFVESNSFNHSSSEDNSFQTILDTKKGTGGTMRKDQVKTNAVRKQATKQPVENSFLHQIDMSDSLASGTYNPKKMNKKSEIPEYCVESNHEQSDHEEDHSVEDEAQSYKEEQEFVPTDRSTTNKRKNDKRKNVQQSVDPKKKFNKKIVAGVTAGIVGVGLIIGATPSEKKKSDQPEQEAVNTEENDKPKKVDKKRK